MILTGALNFQMAAPRFVNVAEEVINVMETNQLCRDCTKDATEFGKTPFKIKIEDKIERSFSWLN